MVGSIPTLRFYGITRDSLLYWSLDNGVYNGYVEIDDLEVEKGVEVVLIH